MPEQPLNASALLAALTSLQPNSPYACGALDMLHLLGLIHRQDERYSPTGKVAALVIDSLRAHVQDGVTIHFDWEEYGVNLLRAIEAARQDAAPNPTPARAVRVVQAVIKRCTDEGDLYLMQYDAPAGQYQPLGGKHAAGDANSEDALRRELAEELELSRLPTPEECEMVLLSEGWTTEALSATYGLLTHYSFDFYHVRRLAFPLPAGSDTRWLTRIEILSGQAHDGQPITDIYRLALGVAQMDALQPTLETG